MKKKSSRKSYVWYLYVCLFTNSPNGCACASYGILAPRGDDETGFWQICICISNGFAAMSAIPAAHGVNFQGFVQYITRPCDPCAGPDGLHKCWLGQR